ncbi:MAG TPA: Hint domain-containing protein [Phycisphaerales bacterium]|nr:Hint domain-containing protein [Phycisphaerales bacterium]
MAPSALAGSTPSASETRTHNAANELTGTTSGSTTRTRYYDQAGNLVLVTSTAGSTTTLVEKTAYDAWNRLVKVERPVQLSQITTADPLDRVEHRYNGLSWRTVEWRRQAARSGGGGTPAFLAQARWFTYTGAWQVAQELSLRPLFGGDHRSLEQQVYGLRGVDDAVLRRVDGGKGTGGVSSSDDGVPDGCFAADLPTLGSTPPDGAALDGGYYQLTDSQFSVVAHLDAATGLVSRRYAYDAYGKLESHALADINGETMCGAGECFVAGTMVVTPDGQRSIESFSVGDRVLTGGTDNDPLAMTGYGGPQYKSYQQVCPNAASPELGMALFGYRTVAFTFN